MKAGESNRSLLPMAEGLLVAVSLATVVGMWRLFVDGSFFWPLAGHAVAAHLVAAGGRRRGLSVGAGSCGCSTPGRTGGSRRRGSRPCGWAPGSSAGRSTRR